MSNEEDTNAWCLWVTGITIVLGIILAIRYDCSFELYFWMTVVQYAYYLSCRNSEPCKVFALITVVVTLIGCCSPTYGVTFIYITALNVIGFLALGAYLSCGEEAREDNAEYVIHCYPTKDRRKTRRRRRNVRSEK